MTRNELIKKRLEMEQYIWGVDPGESTGVARLNHGVLVRTDTFSLDEWYTFCFNLSQSSAGRQDRWRWIVEDFVLYPHMLSKLPFDRAPSAKAIGALMVALKNYDPKNISFQLATHMKTNVKDKDVQEVFGVKGTTRHTKDALKHLIHWASSRLSDLDSDAAPRVS